MGHWKRRTFHVNRVKRNEIDKDRLGTNQGNGESDKPPQHATAKDFPHFRSKLRPRLPLTIGNRLGFPALRGFWWWNLRLGRRFHHLDVTDPYIGNENGGDME